MRPCKECSRNLLPDTGEVVPNRPDMCLECFLKILKNELGDALDRAGLPIIVCLCGSTRFMEAFHKANADETLAGKIVLTVGCSTQDKDLISEGTKAALDKLHLRKIELADEVLVLNVGGYIGESTRRELEYARKLGKTIRFLEVEFITGEEV